MRVEVEGENATLRLPERKGKEVRSMCGGSNYQLGSPSPGLITGVGTSCRRSSCVESPEERNPEVVSDQRFHSALGQVTPRFRGADLIVNSTML